MDSEQNELVDAVSEDGTDPLMSVSAVARDLGVSEGTVARLVEQGKVPSLDRGLLAGEGNYEVPVLRRSWIEDVLGAMPEPRGIIHQDEGADVHPGIQVAIDFHAAAQVGDGEELMSLVKVPNGEFDTADSLGEWCKIFVNGQFTESTGVASVLRSVEPLGEVAALVVSDAQPIPRVFDRITPVSLLAVIPLTTDEGDWLVDLALFTHQGELLDLVKQ